MELNGKWNREPSCRECEESGERRKKKNNKIENVNEPKRGWIFFSAVR